MSNVYYSVVTDTVEPADTCGMIDCNAPASPVAAQAYYVLCQGHFEICVLH